MDNKTTLCKKCGNSDRFPSGGCRICGTEQAKKWNKENRERKNYNKRKWRSEHKNHIKKKRKKYYEANKEAEKKRKQEWERNNRAACIAKRNRRKTRETKAGGSFTGDEWLVLCEKYGNRCLACGKKKKLTVDHVVPVSMGGISDISNLQPLCKSCNSKKHTSIIDYR